MGRARRIAGLASLAGLLALAGTATRAQPSREALAVALEVEVREEPASTQLVVVLSREVAATSFALERPDRVVVEFPDVNCQVAAETTRAPARLVAGYRCGLAGPGRSRLVVELAAPALVRHLSVVDGEAGATHLVVELARCDREQFRRAAGEPRAEPATTGAFAGARPEPLPLVVVDAGHGGHDKGASTAAGQLEKDVVLAFALALRDRLAAGGRVRVVTTRDSDVFVSLDERVAIARAAGADLFVSIHGDHIANLSVRGATIYTGADRPTDPESAGLAERENQVDAAAGAALPGSAAGLGDILHDLTSRETRTLSRRFAAALHRQLAPALAFSAIPEREAGFRVLRNPDVASVLVELGYLSNAADAALLLSEEWRRRTAALMASAVERFLARAPPGRAQPGHAAMSP